MYPDKIKLWLLLGVLVQLIWAQDGIEKYSYQYKQLEIELQRVPEQCAIYFGNTVAQAGQQKIIQNILGRDLSWQVRRMNQKSQLLKWSAAISGMRFGQLQAKAATDTLIKLISPVFREPGSGVYFTVSGECLVRFKNSLTTPEKNRLQKEYSLKKLQRIAQNTYLLSSSFQNGLTLSREITQDDNVLWAQPNFIYPDWGILNSSVNDPLWPSQWAHRNTGQIVSSGAGDQGFPAQVNGFFDADMDVDLAWDLLLENGIPAGGSSSILVAMLDSGVDLGHPDLQNNLISSGIDFTSDGQSDAQDTQGHGTCTAGIVVAEGNNGEGVAGVSFNSKILPIRIMNVWGVAQTSSLVQAIDYAWQNGADILSNSWSGTTPEQALSEAIDRAKTQGRGGLGCVVLFSTGNEGRGTVNYPANLSQVISVGASNMFDEKKHSGSRDYNKTWSSNYGQTLDLVAPTIVYTTDIRGSAGYSAENYFDHFGGTSASCPNVAGVAALMLAANSSLSADEVQNILQQTADKIERYIFDVNGWNQHVGYGRVNAHNAVAGALGLDGTPPLCRFSQPVSSRDVQDRLLSAEISDLNSGTGTVRLYFRSIFNSDTSAWQSLIDTDGPQGNIYEFEIPGQKWGTQVQYYFLVEDLSTRLNAQTYPFGGDESRAPQRIWCYHVAQLATKNYAQTSPISWTNNWKDYKTSVLNITDADDIVDLNLGINYTGNLVEVGIDLTAEDDFGAGLVMHYEGAALTNTLLDDEATQSVAQASAPFTGAFQADNGLFNLDGKTSLGNWKIGVYDGDYTGSNSGSIDSWSIDITYMLPNAAPVLQDIPNQTIAEGDSFATIQLDQYVSDADQPDDSLSWSFSGNQDLVVSIDQNHLARISVPDSNWSGEETIVFTVQDPGAYADSDTVLFSVTGVNSPPRIDTIPDQTIQNGTSFDPILLDDYVFDPDNADWEISWSVRNNQQLGVFIDSQRIAFITPPDSIWTGQELVTFIAQDPLGLSDSSSVTFSVQAVADYPPQIIAPLPTVHFAEDDSIFIPFSSWYPFVEDVDNTDDSLEYRVQNNQQNLQVIPFDNGYRFLASKDWFGADSLLLTVSDGQLADSSSFLVQVDPRNDAPQIINLPDSLVLTNSQTDTLWMENYQQDIDSADSLLNWNFASSDSLFEFDFNSQVNQVILSAPDFTGVIWLYMVLTDDSSATDSASLRVVVKPTTGFDRREGHTPQGPVLYQNYPNPFNPLTIIKYRLDQPAEVNLTIYNSLGQKIKSLVSEQQPTGEYQVIFTAQNLSSGIYLCQLRLKNKSGIHQFKRKMLYLK